MRAFLSKKFHWLALRTRKNFISQKTNEIAISWTKKRFLGSLDENAKNEFANFDIGRNFVVN